MASADECLFDYWHFLEAALHCVTQAKTTHSGWAINTDHSISFQHFPEITLRRSANRSPLRLKISIGYRITPMPVSESEYHLTISYYAYSISAINGREIVVFHWHPGGVGIDWPHLHVGSLLVDSSQHDIGRRFSRLHLPTSRVSIEQVVRALITQFDVTPIRSDWQTILDEGDLMFRQARTWA